jgi:hypothetical protein
MFREVTIVVQFMCPSDGIPGICGGFRGQERTAIPLRIHYFVITHTVVNRNAEVIGDQTGVVALLIRNQVVENVSESAVTGRDPDIWHAVAAREGESSPPDMSTPIQGARIRSRTASLNKSLN